MNVHTKPFLSNRGGGGGGILEEPRMGPILENWIAPGAHVGVMLRGPCRRKKWNETWVRIDAQWWRWANQILTTRYSRRL